MLSAAATAGLDTTVFNPESVVNVDTHISLQAVIIASVTALSNVLVHLLDKRRKRRQAKKNEFYERTNSDIPASNYEKIKNLKKN